MEQFVLWPTSGAARRVLAAHGGHAGPSSAWRVAASRSCPQVCNPVWASPLYTLAPSASRTSSTAPCPARALPRARRLALSSTRLAPPTTRLRPAPKSAKPRTWPWLSVNPRSPSLTSGGSPRHSSPEVAAGVESSRGTSTAAAPAPEALRLQREAPIFFRTEMPPPCVGNTRACETYHVAHAVGEFFDIHPGPYSLAYRTLASELRAQGSWIRGVCASDGHRFASLAETALGLPVRARFVRATALR